MNEERRRILQMLAEGKITTDETERLLVAIGGEASAGADASFPISERQPKYLRVLVDDDSAESPTKVNIRVPMQLLRAGVRLGALIPTHARAPLNRALNEHGIDFDVGQIKPENVEALIQQLNDLSVDVDQEKTKVRVFCE